jgi:hypothetical protein
MRRLRNRQKTTIISIRSNPSAGSTPTISNSKSKSTVSDVKSSTRKQSGKHRNFTPKRIERLKINPKLTPQMGLSNSQAGV